MKFWLLSDLHQEFLRDPTYGSHPATAFDPAAHAPADFDMVALLGDVDVPLSRSLEWIASRFPGVPTVYVPGNHDFYGEYGQPEQTTLEQHRSIGRELADRLGIHLLDDASLEHKGVRFLGGTLWTDMMLGTGTLVGHIREAAGRHGMNDYKAIKRLSSSGSGKRKRIRPEDTVALHKATRAFIERELAKPFDGETVVLTHHAPHRNCLDSQFSSLNFCYASNLDLILRAETAPAIWCHGHIHGHTDHVVERTRIVSNGRGYQFARDEKRTFVPDLVIEVPTPALAPGMG